MNDESRFVAAVLKELATSTAVILAAWGALGGATNALTTKMRLRDALRHILLGGLIAAGMGSLSMALQSRVSRFFGGSASGKNDSAAASAARSSARPSRPKLPALSNMLRSAAARSAGGSNAPARAICAYR